MNKQELIAIVAEKLDASKASTKLVVNEVITAMAEALASGENISITELGTLKHVIRKAKVARNPKTGQVVNVPQKKTVVFKVSTGLKYRINN